MRTRDGAHDGQACSYSLPNELSLASGPCSTSWRDQQVCSVRRCLVLRSSWQPVRTSPACPPDTVLPRPCCRAAWNFVSDYREQKRLTFRRRDADRCAGLPCRYGWGNATVHRGMRDAAEIPPDRTFRSPPPSRRQSSRLGHPLRMILFCFRCTRVTSGRVSVGRAFRGSASVDGSSVNI